MQSEEAKMTSRVLAAIGVVGILVTLEAGCGAGGSNSSVTGKRGSGLGKVVNE